MNPKGKKFIALFLILSFLAINCITLKLPERKVRQRTSAESKQDIIALSKGSIKPGTRILVVLNSGALVSGKFAGLAQVPPEEYAASYAKCREQMKEELMLPALGESVIIINVLGNKFEFEFLGFDYGIIQIRQIGRAKSEKAKLSSIVNISDSNGDVSEIKTINKLISEGKIPLLSSGIVVKSKVGRTQINWEDIYQIEVKKKGMPLFATAALIAAGVAIVAYILYKEIEKSVDEAMNEACAMGAAYDSPAHPYVIILQDFRDTYLMPCKIGRKLVNVYYKYSPFFAHFIAKHKALKIVVRTSLLPLVGLSYSMVHLGMIITAAMLVFIFISLILLISFYRRKTRRVEAKSPKALTSLD
jgi:hypothetical protein